MEISLSSIEKARQRIKPYAVKTPIRPWEYLRRFLKFEAPVYLKLETLQNTGAFKVRGAANKILSLIEEGKKPAHVVAASAGNHAQAVAYVCGRLGIACTIVMPEGSPLVKAAATRDYGAKVILHGLVYDDAFRRAQEVLAQTPGSVYVHAYEDPAIICGQGTLGLELSEQLTAEGLTEDNWQVVVPIGGGGLMSGVALALKAQRPKTTLLGVVGEAAPAMAESFRAGHIVQNAGRTRTLAEGLAVKKVSQLTFDILQKNVDSIAITTDDEIAQAIAALMERGKLVVEGSGAAGVAACMAGHYRLDPRRPLAIVLCGGNIDMNLVSNILERGLSKSGRWLTLEIMIEDKPGELSRVTRVLGETGANILDITHDRISGRCPLGHTLLRVQLETRGEQHVREIRAGLERGSYKAEVLNR